MSFHSSQHGWVEEGLVVVLGLDSSATIRLMEERHFDGSMVCESASRLAPIIYD